MPWYDDQAPNKPYIECTNGDAIIAALDAAGAPSGGNKTGIGTWTKGAMDFAKAYIAKAKADHPMDMDKRKPVLMVVTDGKWTNPQGNQTLAPANQNPAITAGDLFNNQDIPTYVVTLGDAMDLPFADELAMAGGTDAAALPQALASVAGRTRTMEDEFIAASGTDVTDAFRLYLRPLLGSGMPDAFRLRTNPVEKVLRRA